MGRSLMSSPFLLKFNPLEVARNFICLYFTGFSYKDDLPEPLTNHQPAAAFETHDIRTNRYNVRSRNY